MVLTLEFLGWLGLSLLFLLCCWCDTFACHCWFDFEWWQHKKSENEWPICQVRVMCQVVFLLSSSIGSYLVVIPLVQTLL